MNLTLEKAPLPIPSRGPVDWAASAPFVLIHLGALLPIIYGFSPTALCVCLCSYMLRMFAITGGYHRYFSHRTYKMGRVMQFILAAIGTMSVQKGPLWWAAHHRRHHRVADTWQDPHSPRVSGFWWAHVGWILSNDYDRTETNEVRDLTVYPELVWLDRRHYVPPILFAAALYFFGGALWLIWGFFVSTVLLYHATFCINSLAHVWGTRRFQTKDDSRNNFWLALLTMGEGWHNNHHRAPTSERQGFYWWEFDATHYILKGLAALGLVARLRPPPPGLV